MGKGSAPRPFTDREVFESNFDKIFRSKKQSDDVSPHTLEYEYELNKSTGNVEKTYSRIDVIAQNGNEGLHYPESLEQGTSKPNGEQFGNESNSTES
jgi:hypothetical protein